MLVLVGTNAKLLHIHKKITKYIYKLENEIKCPSLDTKTQMDKFGHYWTIWTFGQTKMAQTKQMVKRDGRHKRDKRYE